MHDGPADLALGPRARLVPLRDGAVDLGRELVTRRGRATPLTTREVALFAYLAERPGQAVSRDELYAEVWGYAAAAVSRAVDTTIRRLRAKIEADPSQPAHLQTVHGHGYRFRPHDAEADAEAEALASATCTPGDDDPRAGVRAAAIEAVDRFGRVGIVGVPGVGKSRLLHEIADRLRDAGRSVQVIDGARAPTADALAHRVAGAVGISLDGEDVVRRVGVALAARGGVWIVDGVEPAALGAIAAWSSATVLFSCRERRDLGRGGRAAWLELGPLPPEAAQALFVARATACDPTFRAEPATVARIVERLDCLPLAIELAAARAHVLSPGALLDRLERGQVLGAGTLDRAFAASWDGLGAPEQAALAQCAVFEGWFTLDAAEAVVDGVRSVLDALTTLRDRSLVGAERGRVGLRFGLLHAVRAFVLSERPIPPALRSRHRRWLVRAGEALVAALDGERAPSALDELRALRPDLAAAVASGDPEPGVVRVFDALLDIDGPVSERIAVLGRALAAADEPVARADLLRRSADALRIAGQPAEALEAANRAIASAPAGEVRARALVAAAYAGCPSAGARAAEALSLRPPPPVAVLAWIGVGVDARRNGRDADAEVALRRALELVRACGIVRYEGAVLANLANSRRAAGQAAEAEALYVRSSQASARMGQVRAAAAALHNLGGLRAERGDVDGAVAVAREALAVARAGGEVAVVAHASHALGHLLHRAGALAEAEEAYVEAVGLLRGVDPELAASALGDLGALLADRGLIDAADRTLAESDAGAPASARAVAGLHRAHLDLARARAATDPEERARWVASARARIEAPAVGAGERCTMAALLARQQLARVESERVDG